MSELQIIESTLEKAANRSRWERALRGMWRGLLVGVCIAFIVVGLYHFLPVPEWAYLSAGLLPLPCMLIGLILGGWRKPKLKQIARWVDGKEQLKERLSTALEFSGKTEAGPWRDLVVNDAAAHAKSINPQQLVPFH